MAKTISSQDLQSSPRMVANIKNRKTNLQFIAELKEKRGNEFIALEEYKFAREKIKFLHMICGNTIEMTPDNMLRGKGCHFCAFKSLIDSKYKPDRYWEEKLKELVGDEYEFIDKPEHSEKKCLVRHNVCGLEYRVTPGRIIRDGRRCPYCSKSHAEKHIRSWLLNSGIKFVQEYRFKDCRHKLPLPFDFLVYTKDSFFLIEYDGLQHFYDSYFEAYEDRKIKDMIKNDYCRSNHITLYRIPYTMYDRPGAKNEKLNKYLEKICDDCK